MKHLGRTYLHIRMASFLRKMDDICDPIAVVGSTGAAEGSLPKELRSIHPHVIYTSKQLKALLGKTLYGQYIRAVPPAVRGRHYGAAVLEALATVAAAPATQSKHVNSEVAWKKPQFFERKKSNEGAEDDKAVRNRIYEILDQKA